MALQHALVIVAHDQLRELRRQEAAEASESLEILDLRADSVLQPVVPLGKLGSLALDRVVELLDAQQGADTSQELRLVDRSRDEVVRAGLDGAHLVLVPRGGEHHHREHLGGGVLAQPAADIVAVHLGHDDVEQDDVGCVVLEPGEGLGA